MWENPKWNQMRKTREICAPILDNNDKNITIEAINQTKQTEIIKQLQGNYSHSAANDWCSSTRGTGLRDDPYNFNGGMVVKLPRV